MILAHHEGLLIVQALAVVGLSGLTAQVLSKWAFVKRRIRSLAVAAIVEGTAGQRSGAKALTEGDYQ